MTLFDQANEYLDRGEGARAIELFKRSVQEEERVAAMHALGHCHLYGIGVDQNYDEAFKWFTMAASHGCPQGMYHLGVCNEAGYGTPKNLDQAAHWFQESANRGDEDAMFRLGQCYEKGLGVAQDVKVALKWYDQAAELGQADADQRRKSIRANTQDSRILNRADIEKAAGQSLDSK